MEVLEFLASSLGRSIWSLVDFLDFLWRYYELVSHMYVTSGYQSTTWLFRLYKCKIHDYQRGEFLIQAHIRIIHSQFNYLLLPGCYFQK